MALQFITLERAMEKVRQRRYSATAWRRMLARFEESGLTAIAFCEREGISSKSFYRWRVRLGRVTDQPLVAKAAQVTNAAAGFIDLGALGPANSRMELRLDLGGGMQLHLVRG
jgi:transposase-like protein